MVELSVCPACSSPVVPGQAYCASCGAAVPGTSAKPNVPPYDSEPADTASPQAEVGAEATAEVTAGDGPVDLRLAALGLTTGATPEAPTPIEPPVRRKPPAPLAEAAAAALAQAQPESGSEPIERVPGGYVPPMAGPEPSAWTLQPSNGGSVARAAGGSLSVSVGAVPVSPLSQEVPSDVPPPDVPQSGAPSGWPATPSPTVAPMPAFAPIPGPVAAAPIPAPIPAPDAPFPAAPSSAMAPWAAPAAGAAVTAPSLSAPVVDAADQQTSDVPTRKESIQELVAFGLAAAGAASGIASLFLPWAGLLGQGVGADTSSQPNQWGWGFPAGIPLFLLSAIVLGAVALSDRAQLRLPNFAPVIARVTDLVLPMILGGLYLGVFLLYITLPWGCGGGLFGMLLGSALSIAGGVVALFFPPVAAGEAGLDSETAN